MNQITYLFFALDLRRQRGVPEQDAAAQGVCEQRCDVSQARRYCFVTAAEYCTVL